MSLLSKKPSGKEDYQGYSLFTDDGGQIFVKTDTKINLIQRLNTNFKADGHKFVPHTSANKFLKKESRVDRDKVIRTLREEGIEVLLFIIYGVKYKLEKFREKVEPHVLKDKINFLDIGMNIKVDEEHINCIPLFRLTREMTEDIIGNVHYNAEIETMPVFFIMGKLCGGITYKIRKWYYIINILLLFYYILLIFY